MLPSTHCGEAQCQCLSRQLSHLGAGGWPHSQGGRLLGNMLLFYGLQADKDAGPFPFVSSRVDTAHSFRGQPVPPAAAVPSSCRRERSDSSPPHTPELYSCTAGMFLLNQPIKPALSTPVCLCAHLTALPALHTTQAHHKQQLHHHTPLLNSSCPYSSAA
jgi:hypothetical protein